MTSLLMYLKGIEMAISGGLKRGDRVCFINDGKADSGTVREIKINADGLVVVRVDWDADPEPDAYFYNIDNLGRIDV